MANFNIYIPQKYEPILEGMSQEGESIGQVIKRLVLGMLDGENRQSSPMPPDLGDRLSALEKKIAILPPDLDRRLKILDDLINQIANFDPAPKPETAIMIQKQPLPTDHVPLSMPIELTLTHEEAAREFQRTARTVKGWANDPDKWPDGWIYDGDKQLWIKEI